VGADANRWRLFGILYFKDIFAENDVLAEFLSDQLNMRVFQALIKTGHYADAEEFLDDCNGIGFKILGQLADSYVCRYSYAWQNIFVFFLISLLAAAVEYRFGLALSFAQLGLNLFGEMSAFTLGFYALFLFRSSNILFRDSLDNSNLLVDFDFFFFFFDANRLDCWFFLFEALAFESFCFSFATLFIGLCGRRFYWLTSSRVAVGVGGTGAGCGLGKSDFVCFLGCSFSSFALAAAPLAGFWPAKCLARTSSISSGRPARGLFSLIAQLQQQVCHVLVA
jgi:hypothetical protein